MRYARVDAHQKAELNMVVVQHKVDAAAGTFYYIYTDHLGSVVALSTTGGALVSGSLARFDPFGNYRTLPSTNPGTTNHGFTGHRHNNTGAYPTLNVGLIYKNAQYYLPEVGRFISADSIVPNPQNPQSHNRYRETSTTAYVSSAITPLVCTNSACSCMCASRAPLHNP